MKMNLDDNVELIRSYMPEQSVLKELASYFSLFSNSTRIKVIFALALGELCVNDMVKALELNQSTVSHQLRLLRDAKIVDYRRQGKNIVYALTNDKEVGELMNIVTKYI